MYTVADWTKGRLQQFCSSLTWLAKIPVGLWGKVGQKRKCAQDLEGEREAAATMLKATVVRGGEQQTSRAYLNLVCPRCLLSTPGSSGWLTEPDAEAADTPTSSTLLPGGPTPSARQGIHPQMPWEACLCPPTTVLQKRWLMTFL